MNTNYDKYYDDTIERIALLQYWIQEDIDGEYYDCISQYTDLIQDYKFKLRSRGYDDNRIFYDVINCDLGVCS